MYLWVFGDSITFIRSTHVNRRCFSCFYGSLLPCSDPWTNFGSAYESSSVHRSVHLARKIWARHHAFIVDSGCWGSRSAVRNCYDTRLFILRSWWFNCSTESCTKTMPTSWWRMCHGQHIPFLSLSYASNFDILVCTGNPHCQRKKHKTTKVWCNCCFCCSTCSFDLHSDRRIWWSMLQPSYCNLSNSISVESTS